MARQAPMFRCDKQISTFLKHLLQASNSLVSFTDEYMATLTSMGQADSLRGSQALLIQTESRCAVKELLDMQVNRMQSCGIQGASALITFLPDYQKIIDDASDAAVAVCSIRKNVLPWIGNQAIPVFTFKVRDAIETISTFKATLMDVCEEFAEEHKESLQQTSSKFNEMNKMLRSYLAVAQVASVTGMMQTIKNAEDRKKHKDALVATLLKDENKNVVILPACIEDLVQNAK
jgi:hypothetical protein